MRAGDLPGLFSWETWLGKQQIGGTSGKSSVVGGSRAAPCHAVLSQGTVSDTALGLLRMN